MALVKYTKLCAKNVPGNKGTFFMAHIADITSVAETSDAISAVTMETGKLFQPIQADFDTVQFTSNGAGGTNFFETQNLIAKFSILGLTLLALKAEIAAGLPCGFAIIRVDNNGHCFLSGVSLSTKEGKERPWNKATIEFDSGTVPTDEGTQAVTLTLERMGGYSETPFDTTLTGTIKGGSAAFINW